MRAKVYLNTDSLKSCDKFEKVWNALPSAILPTQRRIIQNLIQDIVAHLSDDPRPDRHPKYPWKDHNMLGDLRDSMFQSSKAMRGSLTSSFGYGEEYGNRIEPPATVKQNVFVPNTWSGQWHKDLQYTEGEENAIAPTEPDLDNLEGWAYDIITRRTTGKKLRGAAARAAAKRWARNLSVRIANIGQYGYPTIVPMAERLFEGAGGEPAYLDQIVDAIDDALKRI